MLGETALEEKPLHANLVWSGLFQRYHVTYKNTRFMPINNQNKLDLAEYSSGLDQGQARDINMPSSTSIEIIMIKKNIIGMSCVPSESKDGVMGFVEALPCFSERQLGGVLRCV